VAQQDHLTGAADRTSSSDVGALVHSKDLKHFDFPKGEPDPRGWDVRSADGNKLGKVSDLIVDTSAGRVRYLEVKVDDDLAKGGGRDWALIPVGAARLDDDDDDVIVDLTAADIAGIPAYDRARLSRDYEQSLRGYVRGRSRRPLEARPAAGRGDIADSDVDFYASSDYDDSYFFRSSRRRGGESGGAADRATTTGLADRVSDAVDNVKDRFDGNPASRPGPDATDRPI